MNRHVYLGLLMLTTVAILSACGGEKQQSDVAVEQEAAVESVTVIENEDTDVSDEAVEEEFLFADLDPQSLYYETIASAKDKGLLEGFLRDDQFHPDELLENADIPLLFWNAAGRPEAEPSVDIANLDQLNEEKAKAAQWYYEAYRGFMFTEGKQPALFEPDQPANDTSFGNASFLATERLGMDHKTKGGYSVVYLDEESANQTITRAEAIKELDTLTDLYPVGTEFVKELSDDLMQLVAEADLAKVSTTEVAQAEPAKEEPKPQAEASKTEPAPAATPAETQSTAPPPPATPSAEEIAAAQAAAQAQAEAEAKAAAEAAAKAQAAAQAQAQAQAAAEAAAKAQAEAAAQAAAQAQAQAAAEAAAAQAAAEAAAGNFLDPVWVRSQILSTAEANGFYCTEVTPGLFGMDFVIKAHDTSWQNRYLYISYEPGQSYYHCVYGRSLAVSGGSSTINFYSVDEIKNFIASHAY